MNQLKQPSLWQFLEEITGGLKYKRLADVFRFVSFHGYETFGPHKHVRIEMNYVKKGGCVLHMGDETVGFSENEIMIIGSNVEHTFEAGTEDTVLMQLEFLPEIFSLLNPNAEETTGEFTRFPVFRGETKLIKIVNDVRIMRVVRQIIDELKKKEEYYQYLVLMYYAQLLVLICRYMDKTCLPACPNEILNKTIAYLHENYHSEINMQELAFRSGVSTRYLRKLFVRYLNMPPTVYLNRVRVDKAVELLNNTEKSVKEISFLCGFRSPQYFSKVFKLQKGMSPREVEK